RHLLARREPRALHAVHRLHAMRQLQLPVRADDGIHPRGRHGARGGEDARAGNLTPTHGELHVHVRVHRALGLEVADRGEAVLQRSHGRSSLPTAPPFITKATFSSVATSASGSPCTAITSA